MMVKLDADLELLGEPFLEDGVVCDGWGESFQHIEAARPLRYVETIVGGTVAGWQFAVAGELVRQRIQNSENHAGGVAEVVNMCRCVVHGGSGN